MKKILLLTITITVCTISNAQFEKGQKILGGSIGFNLIQAHNDSTVNYPVKTNTTAININPSIAWAKKSNRLEGFGIVFGYNGNKQKNMPSSSELKSNAFSFGINYFNTYYKKLATDFYVFINWNNSVTYTTAKSDVNYYFPYFGPYTRYSAFNINTSLNPGFAYKISNRFLLEATLNNIAQVYINTVNGSFNNSTNTVTYYGTSTNIAFASSLSAGAFNSIGLGFRYLLK